MIFMYFLHFTILFKYQFKSADESIFLIDMTFGAKVIKKIDFEVNFNCNFNHIFPLNSTVP